MKIVADLEVHSKFARAVSPQMDIPTIAAFAKKKGLGIVGTGDFTHPFWFSELKRSLEPAEPGLYKLKGSSEPASGEDKAPQYLSEVSEDKTPRFMLTAELSSIYSHNGKTRRIHNLIFAPSLEVVEKINAALSARGCNLHADGRPVIGLSSKEVLKIVLDVSGEAVVIPAHVWTPWFSLFGSMSGYDSIEECFEELTPHISAIETGLSSDPAMNWRLSKLDSVAIVSFGDAHSPQNLMREATVFEVEELSYASIVEAIKNGSARARASQQRISHQSQEKLVTSDSGLVTNSILKTIEFYPEEGMYHFDGHRNCNVRWSPKETLDHQGICEKCGKAVTVGVMHRVEKLADRAEGFRPDGVIPYENLVPLDEIIAEAFGVKSANSKKVLEEYERLVTTIAPEYQLLSEIPIDEISKHSPRVAEGIERVRTAQLTILPGFDGQYGTIDIFPEAELSTPQASLF